MMIITSETYVDGEIKTMVTMRDPVKSQKNVTQSGDKDYGVDCEHVMMVTMRDPVKSQNVAILCGGPVLLHRVAPLLDQSWHLFDVAHELVVEELVEHHDDNSAEVHFARDDNLELELSRN